MKRVALLIIVVLTSCIHSLKCQNQSAADSLQNLLQIGNHTDSSLYILYLDIARNSVSPDDILQYAEKAKTLSIEASKPKWKAISDLSLGDGHRLKGNLPKAIEHYLECAKYARDSNEYTVLASAFDNVANVYGIQGDYTNALHYQEQAIDLYKTHKITNSLAPALINLGELYRTKGELDLALVHLKDSKRLCDSLNWGIGIAYSQGNIGLVYAEKEQYDLAEENINQAIEILDELSDYYPIAVYQTYLGDIYKEKGELSRALEFVTSAYDVALEYGLKEQIRDAGLKLSELYQESKDFEKAYFYQSQYIIYRDSLNNEETIRKMADLRTEYEVSQKQAEVDILNQEAKNQRILVLGLIVILALVMGLAYVMYKIYRLKLKANEILSKRNKEIEKQRNQLDALNQTKDRFFSIVSHDLRGPVSSFQGVSEILKEMVVEREFEELENTAGRLEKSSRQLSLLLDNLLGWAQGQQGKFPYNPERLSLSDIFDSTLGIVENMANSKNQKLKYNMNYELELWADRDSCLAIFRNLLGNSIKFTPEGGSIEFSSGRGTEYAVLAVKDSGVGIPEEKLSGIFNFKGNRSSWGTHGEKGMGLGLILVHEFVEMNKGKIDVTSKEGKGTTITVRLPLYKNQAVAS